MAVPESLPAAAWSPPAWHAIPLENLVQQLATDALRGLSVEEAARRLAKDGPNVLEEPLAVPWWRTFLAQFRELVIWILIAAAAIAGAMGDWADTAAIVAIVLVNAVIGCTIVVCSIVDSFFVRTVSSADEPTFNETNSSADR